MGIVTNEGNGKKQAILTLLEENVHWDAWITTTLNLSDS